MELAGVLSNPEVGPKLDRLAEVLARLKPSPATHRVVLQDLPPSQGKTLRTIKKVLADYPDGLRAFEVRRLVELTLRRKLPDSTVRDALRSNPAFERIERGKYRRT